MAAYKQALADDTRTSINTLVVFLGETLTAIAHGQGGAELEAALRRRSVARLERLEDGLAELQYLVVDVEGFPVIAGRDTGDALREVGRILDHGEREA
jgi:hypothetical protein